MWQGNEDWLSGPVEAQGITEFVQTERRTELSGRASYAPTNGVIQRCDHDGVSIGDHD